MRSGDEPEEFRELTGAHIVWPAIARRDAAISKVR